MTPRWRTCAVLLAACGSLAGCGGGQREELVNTDCSALRLAPSHEGALRADPIIAGTPWPEFKGAIETAESDGSNPFPVPPHTVPRRAVPHDDAVLVVDGERLPGELWSGVAF